ncbi:nitroreductase family protein [Corynebacterium terpenotabidum]|uniref:Nitro/flavin reductase n=1 Tax=Corynebacterium terpenotabidum Y-11 TaxID=1200352 RepID=S4XIJ9_9CORY|nr:nitroreductase family protein [Corynebacterium terpenotabidum]AGP30433.1 nitro/flavin reductase [Corynebacterium terpenotabidum Y-11]
MTDLHSPAARLTDRYGSRAAAALDPASLPWNDTVDLLVRHRSVREWLPRDIDDATLRVVLAAAQSAPTSSNKQIVSVIAVRDAEAKNRLAAVGKQMSSQVADAPVTLVWLIDFSLGRFAAAREDAAAQDSAVQDAAGTGDSASSGHGATSRPPTDLGALSYLDEPMMAAADIGIAAQNAAVAAESLGLGTVFLGSLRNDIDTVRDILDIPETVVPFLGLVLGYPDPAENAGVKPRLLMDVVLHRDRYTHRTDEEYAAALDAYNTELASYYSRYGSHPTWTSQLLHRLSAGATEKSKRRLLRQIMERAGFALH